VKATPTFWEVISSMPALSGVALLIILGVGGWFGRRKMRSANYSKFRFTHQILAVLWPIFLFLHGSNNWVGIGIPLIIPFAVAVLPWIFDVLRRVEARWWPTTVFAVLLRPGAKPAYTKRALLRLDLVRPAAERWRRCKAGMYARLCVPQISQEWHAFTICSGEQSDCVSFIIESVGDWTSAFVELVAPRSQIIGPACSAILPIEEQARTPEHLGLHASPKRGALFPKVLMEGPFTAPFEGSCMKQVVAAVGAGVGATPLLAMLETMVSKILTAGDELLPKEAHFYWCSRNANDFRFALPVIARILESPEVARIITVHLHLTVDPKEPEAKLFKKAACQWANTAAGAEVRDSHRLLESDEFVMGYESVVPGGVPVIFGRPNFEKMLRKLGANHPTEHVHTFVCGNKGLVSNLQQLCDACTVRATSKLSMQQYVLHHENFD